MARRFFTPSVAPTQPIVSLDDMKLHLRRDDDDDNAAIMDAEAAAVRHIESLVNRLMPARPAVLRLACLPYGRSAVELPGGDVQSLDGITINGVEFAPDAFIVLGGGPAKLIPSIDWPAVSDPDQYPVEIRYTVGYSEVPADLKAAVKLLAAHFYENREAVVLGAAASTLPFAVDALVAQHRIKAR